MPQPVSRLFPKLSAKSDDAQLTLTANAISVLFTAGGANHSPTLGAPKLLPIVFDHPVRLILRVNGSSTPIPMLCKHLEDALVSNASLLDIASVSSPDDHVLKLQARKPLQEKQYLPHAVLDYITIDYRFSRLSSTFEGTAGSGLGLFLPLRQLLDQVVHCFLRQLIRQLPEAFGTWKETLANEMLLARHAARHLSYLLNLSKNNSGFQRRVQEQLLRMDACLNSAQDELVADLGQHVLLAEDAPDSQNSTLDIRMLLPFAVQTTYKQNIRPKISKQHRVARSQAALELIDDLDPDTFSSQDPMALASSQDTFNDDEQLQLDSPTYSSSPVPSIIQAADTAPLDNDSDADLDLDLDSVDWHEVGNADSNVGVKIAEDREAMEVDEWVDLSIPHKDRKDRTEFGLEIDISSPLGDEVEDGSLEKLLCDEGVTEVEVRKETIEVDPWDVGLLDLD